MTHLQLVRHVTPAPPDRRASPWALLAVACILGSVAVLVVGEMGWLRDASGREIPGGAAHGGRR